MTPINNNQMSEELEKIIKEAQKGCDQEAYLALERLVAPIQALISHERAEAVRRFAKGLSGLNNYETIVVHLEDFEKTNHLGSFTETANPSFTGEEYLRKDKYGRNH